MRVTVLGIRGANVKPGFEADPDIPVHRSEVWERIDGNGREETQTGGPAPPAE
jgi:sRNA-binding carbon storage regulator CsrA